MKRHKTIICEAAKLTIFSAQNSNDGLSIDQQLYWSMVVVRCRFDVRSSKCLRALDSYPYIKKFVDMNIFSCDLDALCSHIAILQHNRCLKTIQDGPREDESKHRFKDRMNKLGQYLSLWASRRKKIANLSISHEDGRISTSTEEAALFLSDHWAPKFQQLPISLPLALAALKDIIPICPPCIDPVVSFDLFCDRIDKLIDSGTGCDSMIYSCWKKM